MCEHDTYKYICGKQPLACFKSPYLEMDYPEFVPLAVAQANHIPRLR